MDLKEWAAIGAVVSGDAESSKTRKEVSRARTEASYARTEVKNLRVELQRIQSDIDKQKHEREFQKWAEELVYQFNKTVIRVSNSPANPLDDYTDITSFFHIIEENKLNTSLISGLENKEKFEQTFLKAKNLIEKLKNTPELQDHLHQQELAQQEDERLREQERLREEERLLKQATQMSRHTKKARITLYLLGGLFWLSIIMSVKYSIYFLYITGVSVVAALILNQTGIKLGWWDKDNAPL